MIDKKLSDFGYNARMWWNYVLEECSKVNPYFDFIVDDGPDYIG